MNSSGNTGGNTCAEIANFEPAMAAFMHRFSRPLTALTGVRSPYGTPAISISYNDPIMTEDGFTKNTPRGRRRTATDGSQAGAVRTHGQRPQPKHARGQRHAHGDLSRGQGLWRLWSDLVQHEGTDPLLDLNATRSDRETDATDRWALGELDELTSRAVGEAKSVRAEFPAEPFEAHGGGISRACVIAGHARIHDRRLVFLSEDKTCCRQ